MPPILPTPSYKYAFTLIELSIVLVIIALVAGSVLVGQELISTAAMRAQISQIEKFQSAVNTFRSKYGYLPGDIPDPQASTTGFQSRGSFAGEGDGNGILQGNCGNAANQNSGYNQGCGELAVFWVDLTTAQLIESGITYRGNGYPAILYFATVYSYSTPGVKDFIPPSKIAPGNFVYVYSNTGVNYFGVSAVNKIGWTIENTSPLPNPGITVQQAYNIDAKIDDGMPQSGTVNACYLNFDVVNYASIWSAGGGNQGAGGANCASTTAATPFLASNCFDNAYAGGAAAPQKYQLQNANLQNCGVSFRFQ